MLHILKWISFLKFEIKNYNKFCRAIENEESEILYSKNGKYISFGF